MDSDQGTKRSSVLFMLPWKLKQGTNLQEDLSVSEQPPHHNSGAENGQLPLPATGSSEAATDPAPAPPSEPAKGTAASCPQPDSPAECPELPPPPEWLQEPSEDPCRHSALCSETEEPLPPEMASSQVILLVLCGEMWRSLSAAAPHHTATTESHTLTTSRSPRADKTPLYQLQTTAPSSHQSDTSLAVTEPQAFPGEEEAGDGSWVAALIIGIILIGMVMAITTILLWKCCTRPALAESHWAGRSPFGTKRSSVLFMLPWKLKQGTNLQEDLSVSEQPPHHNSGAENGQLPLPATGSSEAATDPAPAPPSEPAKGTAASCPQPDSPAECPELPPPPEWLQEPSEDPCRHSALARKQRNRCPRHRSYCSRRSLSHCPSHNTLCRCSPHVPETK
uniref:EVI2B protein n=1 Tax=Malurus cyaneus samueli TaxID=2593467 RepID=A0A8C5TIR0_9PASS